MKVEIGGIYLDLAGRRHLAMSFVKVNGKVKDRGYIVTNLSSWVRAVDGRHVRYCSRTGKLGMVDGSTYSLSIRVGTANAKCPACAAAWNLADDECLNGCSVELAAFDV